MDIFRAFNRKSIDDRQIDTLIGFAKGIVADGIVAQAEAEALHTWLIQSYKSSDNPIIANLLTRTSAMLEDNLLDKNEASELLATLREISGEQVEIGELMKPTTLPLCTPPPEIEVPGKLFLFTGTFAYGTRAQCHAAIEALDGRTAPRLTKKTNYLVIGAYVTDSWAHENFGRKIEQAMQLREEGAPINIISEEYWATELALT